MPLPPRALSILVEWSTGGIERLRCCQSVDLVSGDGWGFAATAKGYWADRWQTRTLNRP